MVPVVLEIATLEGDEADQRGFFGGRADAVRLEGVVQGLGGLGGGAAFGRERCACAGAG